MSLVGGEFRINANDFSSSAPSVAGLPDGSFVVAYQDVESGGLVRVAKFAADGQRLGTRMVAGIPAKRQTSPSVAALDTGGFVVAWNANGDVKSQAYDANLNAVGGELTVDLVDYPATVQRDQVYSEQLLADASPEVADLAGPGYVLAWSLEERMVSRATDGGVGYYINKFKPQAQLVNDGGTARGSVIDLAESRLFEGRVDVAGLATGGFVVAYTRNQSLSSQVYYTQMQLRDASGALVLAGADTPIGRTSALASFASGGFGLVGNDTREQSGSGRSFTATYRDDGTLLGSGPADAGGYSQLNISAAGSRTGYLLTAFEVPESANGTSAGTGIRAVLIGHPGTPVSGSIKVNTTAGAAGGQVMPDVAFLAGGTRAVVVWRDGSTGNIKAQMVAFDQAL